jgi:dCTP deaminase
MFLSKPDILDRRSELFPIADHFDASHLGQVSYDLRVGSEVFLSEKRIPTRLSDESPYVVLPPGQFALVKTYERVRIPPDLIGLISIRSRFKFQGLINISGFHVDPTYEGNLIFSVQNVGPNDIRLEYKGAVFMLMLAELKTKYDGAPRPPGYDRIQLEQMAQLGGPSVTLTTLKRNLDSLSLTLKIYGALAVALFGAIIAALLRWLHP